MMYPKKQKKTKKKNNKAYFSKEVREEILKRDKVCIISGNPIDNYHHIFYGWQINYWPDRNNANQWVWLSKDIHYEIHHWIGWKWQNYRAFCINYLNNLK